MMLALPFIIFSLFFLVHALCWRSDSRKPGISKLTLHGLFWFGLMSGIQWFLEPGWNEILYSGSIYLFLLVAYFHLYMAVEQSVSIRVLGELSAKEDGAISQDQLRKEYSPRFMFSRRLELMVRNGWIEEKGGRYSNLPKGAKLAQLTKRLREFYRLEVTG